MRIHQEEGIYNPDPSLYGDGVACDQVTLGQAGRWEWNKQMQCHIELAQLRYQLPSLIALFETNC